MKKNEFMAIKSEGMKKSDMLSVLRDLPKAVKDSNLLERVKYTLAQADKSLAKVTNADLSALIVEAQGLLSAASVPAEASLKKPDKNKSSKKSDKAQSEDDESTDDNSGKSKKKLKGVKSAPQKVSKNGLPPVASMFPEEVSFETDDGETTLTRAHEKYHSIDEIRKALEDGVELYIAAYWTKRHIKQYNYGQQYDVTAPKSFPDDLDVLSVVLACDTMERLYAMSAYTEALYRFDGEDFMPVEDEDPSDGSKFTVRVSNGLEFEVYEA